MQPSLHLRLQRLWRCLILTLGFMWVLTTTGATASPKNGQGVAPTSKDIYIVLVSIPVLDKVLPLKHQAEALLSRGVRVGFALPENCRHWVSDLKGLEFISLGNIVSKGHPTGWTSTRVVTRSYDSYVNTLLDYASFQRPMYGGLLDNLEDDRPTLVIVDRYTFAGYDVCHRLHLPYVVNDPHLLFDIDSPPAYIPAPFSEITMHTTSLLERWMNSYYRLRFRLGMVYVYQEINAVRHDHGLEAIDSIHQMHGHALVLVNSVFGLDEARPLAPQFKMVGLLQSPTLERERAEAKSSGAARHNRFPAALISWLEELEHVDKPLVFIHIPCGGPLTHQFIISTMNALKSINVRLLWKLTPKQQATIELHSSRTDPIMFVNDELDEAALLALVPEIALLITAGDFSSILEALVAGVPILGLPQSAEQSESLHIVMRAGAGLRLDVDNFSAITLGRIVDWMVIREPNHFKANAQYLGELIKTGGGIERAVDEVLIVAEFGPRHLVPMRTLQPLYKTYLVDVYLIYGAILCGAAIILRTLVSVVLATYQPLTQPESRKDSANDQETSQADMVTEDNALE